LKNRHLIFNTSIGIKKPDNIRNTQLPCPFCARDQLSEILVEDGPILLVKNKFPVLENTYQTVLIETDTCEAELSTYEPEHLHRLIKFGLKHWLEMEESGAYESVLFFKNHGPLSGGSISHPHMQIIGLTEVDYKENTSGEYFEGIEINERNGVRFSLSTKPRVGFYEFNVKMSDRGYVEEFGEYLQMAAHYILNHFPFKGTSYNMFFYHLDGQIYVKIVPRFVTTPIYIGYDIPQVPNNLEWMVEHVKSLYFEVKKM
jgi:ATP adenylyltransferase/5',5'''-P-1,P-4-tetraphosphate phosphorylase II